MKSCPVVLAALLLSLGTACRPRSSPVVPYTAAAPSASAVDFSRHDSIAVAVGLPSLRNVALPEGWRELRMSRGWMEVWQPESLVRLVVSPDGEVAGTYVRYWREGDVPKLFIDQATGMMHGCASVKPAGPVQACTLTVLNPGAWSQLTDSLEALNVWALPNYRSEGGSGPRLHRPALWLEVREGAQYRAMHYRDISGEDSVAVRARAVLAATRLLQVKQ